MRPKIVILILLAGLAGVIGILLIKQPQGAPPTAAAPIAITETKPAAPQTAPAITNVPPPATAPVAAAPVATTNTLTPERRQAAIDAETARLQQWSMNDDPASLSSILADLTNSEKEIREAAIEATEQFGSTNAIPILKNLAANDTDPQEKAALLDAANFISLPSIFDGAQTITPAEREAHRQARMQKAQNQNPPATPNQ
jgi:hypothetical protein